MFSSGRFRLPDDERQNFRDLTPRLDGETRGLVSPDFDTGGKRAKADRQACGHGTYDIRKMFGDFDPQPLSCHWNAHSSFQYSSLLFGYSTTPFPFLYPA